MANDEKGVVVVAPRSGSRHEFRYPEGQQVDVRDGHLFVLGAGGALDAIAVFAPEKWFSADVKR